MEVTTDDRHDSTAAEGFIGKAERKGNIKEVLGDGAYDCQGYTSC